MKFSKIQIKTVYYSFLFLTIFSCKKSNENKEIIQDTMTQEKLFTTLSSKDTGVDFINHLNETLEFNYYKYSYMYIGAGVAAADFNNDGLQDLFFISNSNGNKLYLNKGDLKFEDITESTGMVKQDGFNTGVAVADVNNDGYLDIYVSRGGYQDENNKFANLLYINNGDLTFTEKAKELGLDDANRTIQATFFDYDNDNDLDVYVSNTPDITGKSQVLDLDKILADPKTMELKGSDRLYNNDGTGHFTDVSEKAGLVYDIGFGLNPQVGDINNDGYLDIYVCNDFNFPDLIYMNNGNGTFSEKRNEVVKHMSFNSMGSDMADINNDGLLDLMTLDMNPQDYVRSKTTMAMTSVNTFEDMVANNYHYQYMHNMLQLNNGNGTLSDISKMAGIADTDWSWSLLSADFDLDGFNDIYVTNGVFRDVMHRDVLNETIKELRANQRKPTDEDFLKFAKMLPQQKLNNYFYKNNGDLTFEDASHDWADNIPTFSNGATYADLDNDGDLDVVVNNINDEALVLKNNATELNKGHYLKVDLKGPEKNQKGIGATVKLFHANGTVQTRQLINTKGFLSSVPNQIHFGLPKEASIRKLTVTWLDGKEQAIQNIQPNTSLVVNYSEITESLSSADSEPKSTIFVKEPSQFKHLDPYFNDYDVQVLLPHKMSQTGPGLAKADVNKDGVDDIFVGGGKGQPGQLILGNTNGRLILSNVSPFNLDKHYEDQSACFFDADNDGDQDLYVVSGSYENISNPRLLQDRLYINNGKGGFSKGNLPEFYSSGAAVKPADFDGDGDLDLFVGGRVIPGKYPHAPISYLLLNNEGEFSVATKELAPALERIGMVTDASWTDINGDNKLDLIVTGEWMGFEVFINQNNTLVKDNAFSDLNKAVGWWNRMHLADVDNDGDQDIIAGNLGLNYKFHASYEKPFHVYTTDVDFNGTEDIMLAKNYNGKEVPIRGKTCMTQQIPHLAQKIPTYNEFANLDLEGIVGKRLGSALHYSATEFRSGIFMNQGNGNFTFEAFGNEVQRSPVNSIIFKDITGDAIPDLLLAGNNYHSEVETTRADSGVGSFLKGEKGGSFNYVSNFESGFLTDQDTRNMALMNLGNHELLFVLNNNSYHETFKIKND